MHRLLESIQVVLCLLPVPPKLTPIKVPDFIVLDLECLPAFPPNKTKKISLDGLTTSCYMRPFFYQSLQFKSDMP